MVFFHLKGKTSILGLLLMKGDKEAEITVILLLYEVCRKYYEVQGSYVEISYLGFSRKLPLPWYVAGVMYIHLETAREGPIEVKKLLRISQMSKGLLFTFSSFMVLLYCSVNSQSVLW